MDRFAREVGIRLNGWTIAGAAGLAGVSLWWAERPPAAPVHLDVEEPAEALVRADEAALRDAANGLRLLALAHRCKMGDPLCEPRVSSSIGRRAAKIAKWYVEHWPGGFRNDCSGFVSAVFSGSGVPMDGDTRSIWDIAVEHDALHWRTVPSVGDLVFFDNTTDRNKNGLWDDELTHIGVVVDVRPDGTAAYAHGGTASGRTIGYINVAHPSTARDGNTVLNTPVRTPDRWDPPGAGSLSGELWTAFATVSPKADWLTWPPPEEE